MAKQHRCTQDHCGRVGLVCAHEVLGDVSAARLKERIFLEQGRLGKTTVDSVLLTRPTLQPGTTPGPPTRAAPMFETIAPYKFGMTITSN